MVPECYFLSPHVNPELGHAGYKEEQSSAKLCPIQEKQWGRASWRRWGCSCSVRSGQLRFGKEVSWGVPVVGAEGASGERHRDKGSGLS